MKYIDADLLRKEIERRIEEYNIQSLRGAELSDLLSFIASLQKEQQEVDLEKEIEKELRLHYNDDQDVYWWNYLKNSFRHFYELGNNSK